MDGWMQSAERTNGCVSDGCAISFELGAYRRVLVRGVRYWGFAGSGRRSGSGVTLVAPSLRTGVEREIAKGGEKGLVSHRRGTGRVRVF